MSALFSQGESVLDSASAHLHPFHLLRGSLPCLAVHKYGLPLSLSSRPHPQGFCYFQARPYLHHTGRRFLLDSIGNEGDFLAKPGSTELFLDSIQSLFFPLLALAHSENLFYRV